MIEMDKLSWIIQGLNIITRVFISEIGTQGERSEDGGNEGMQSLSRSWERQEGISL